MTHSETNPGLRTAALRLSVLAPGYRSAPLRGEGCGVARRTQRGSKLALALSEWDDGSAPYLFTGKASGTRRVSLRTLLIATTLVAVVLGKIAYCARS